MKLEEKMYVRTKDGIIDKVIIDYNGHCASPNCECKHISCAKNYYDEDKIVKASYNIIDILEVGDYVNGYKVSYIDINNNILRVEAFCWGTNIIEREYIKTILTKEQFENNYYEVE